jgi:hypothetical protein
VNPRHKAQDTIHTLAGYTVRTSTLPLDEKPTELTLEGRCQPRPSSRGFSLLIHSLAAYYATGKDPKSNVPHLSEFRFLRFLCTSFLPRGARAPAPARARNRHRNRNTRPMRFPFTSFLVPKLYLGTRAIPLSPIHLHIPFLTPRRRGHSRTTSSSRVAKQPRTNPLCITASYGKLTPPGETEADNPGEEPIAPTGTFRSAERRAKGYPGQACPPLAGSSDHE